VSAPGCARQECPTCGAERARFRAWIAAPGYGQSGSCDSCGADLWRCGGEPWIDVRDLDGPPELTEADVR
jgi:hypothetical protein